MAEAEDVDVTLDDGARSRDGDSEAKSSSLSDLTTYSPSPFSSSSLVDLTVYSSSSSSLSSSSVVGTHLLSCPSVEAVAVASHSLVSFDFSSELAAIMIGIAIMSFASGDGGKTVDSRRFGLRCPAKGRVSTAPARMAFTLA